MNNFNFDGALSEIDHDVYEIIQLESERQHRKLILIASESPAHPAIRESLGSVFQNIYAEGYPDDDTRWMSQEEILDLSQQMTHYRRYSDPRYYKGVEYADVIEALARRRCAELFAANDVTANDIYVNVQPLSGAPANSAVYTALLKPGDIILGMNLLHGGHLSHGSSVNRSGILYNVKHYNVDSQTEKIDYDTVEHIALECQPKIIIAGYSSYPWEPDWDRFRSIADKVGAIFLADISHIAGLIAGKAVSSPIGKAHVITFTTHKTLFGPRGAVILTTDSMLSKKIDKGVFPGEQGGPHIHAVAAMATTFKLAQTEQFARMQKQIIKNCQTMTEQFKKRGLRIPFGGTNTHLLNIDCKSIVGEDGTPLSGDIAARILDIAGIVLNRNTIPGDKTALYASGLRIGTPWMTKRGLDEKDMVEVANIITDVLQAIKPYTIISGNIRSERAKIDFKILEDSKIRVRELAIKANHEEEKKYQFSYPHFYYLDDKPEAKDGWVAYDLSGDTVQSFMNYVFSSDTEDLKIGDCQKSGFYTPKGVIECILKMLKPELYQINLHEKDAVYGSSWLRALSDGFIEFEDDLTKRIPGPIVISKSDSNPTGTATGDQVATNKPYFIQMQPTKSTGLQKFSWDEKESQTLRRTSLYENHVKLGAKIIPFAGWEMPVWYTSVIEEHHAVRQSAGLFDVCHMGVYQAEGVYASVFLDSVCANDMNQLGIGQSCYTHFLDPDANVIDDLLVYRRSKDKYLIVVNASNDDKNWAWLNAVKNGQVMIDHKNTGARAFGRNVILRNLRDEKEGKDMRVDIALQGPRSRDILLTLDCDQITRNTILGLQRTHLCEAKIGGFDLVISRTGYTGEKMSFELFVHPDHASKLWDALLSAGKEYGIKPCGLGARDSLRTEAGLPLYGHEMGGELGLSVQEAGFGSYVKIYKPWFIGREAYINRSKQQTGTVVRFRFDEKGIRMAHLNDPVVDKKGRIIGKVTSCAIDSEGFLTGQAYLDLKSSEEGTPIAIYQGSPKSSNKAPFELEPGDKVVLPTSATIVCRFPKPVKKS